MVMSSFADDKAFRPFATGEEKSAEEKPKGNIILFTDGCFFVERDKDMKPKEGQLFCDRVADDLLVAQAGKHVIVMLDEEHTWMKDRLEAKKIEVFMLKLDAAGETTLRLVTMLRERGVRFRPFRNMRSVAHLNISKFIVEGAEVFGPSDYELLGVKPEKELVFEDFKKERARKAWP
jgi:hypothetical protein